VPVTKVFGIGQRSTRYAESILKTCTFGAVSRLACVSGVTGADLKRRIAYIMTHAGDRKLDPGRKLLLAIAGLLAISVPTASGMLSAIGPVPYETPERARGTDTLNTPRRSQDEPASLAVMAAPKMIKKRSCSKSRRVAKPASSITSDPAKP
jgi:hypothetical protein